MVIAPFGSAFYVVWEETRSARYDVHAGTRVLLDGSAPDIVPSRREQKSITGAEVHAGYGAWPSPFGVGVHPYGSRLAVTFLRPYGYGLATAFVDAHGVAMPSGYQMSLFDLPFTTRSVRLLDGSIVVIYAKDGVATVKTLLTPGPRRRSARH